MPEIDGNDERSHPDQGNTGDVSDSEVPARQAVFAGGCFWCVEAVFRELAGVIDVTSGYAGGLADLANYDAVKSGQTDHAEVVRITYDPSQITYERLLEIHFALHDPTTLNQQGNDKGPQYRSSIFYANESEKQAAAGMIEKLTSESRFTQPIVTTLEQLDTFYEAEAYHQDYVCHYPNQPYIKSVALPKVKKVRELFKDEVRTDSAGENVAE
jgi:peptide-methionine (S)-S-oxide reductase